MDKFLRGDGEWAEINYEVNYTVEDFIFSKEQDKRGTMIEKLPSGQNLALLEDLEYFQKKFWESLRIPPEYLHVSMKGLYEYFALEVPKFRVLITEQQWATINYDRAIKVVDAYRR